MQLNTNHSVMFGDKKYYFGYKMPGINGHYAWPNGDRASEPNYDSLRRIAEAAGGREIPVPRNFNRHGDKWVTKEHLYLMPDETKEQKDSTEKFERIK